MSDNQENPGMRLGRIILVALVYIFVVTPVLSLITIDTMHLGGSYLLPVAAAWILMGVYLIENTFSCTSC